MVSRTLSCASSSERMLGSASIEPIAYAAIYFGSSHSYSLRAFRNRRSIETLEAFVSKIVINMIDYFNYRCVSCPHGATVLGIVEYSVTSRAQDTVALAL